MNIFEDVENFRNQIKTLLDTVKKQQGEIDSLKGEVASLRGGGRGANTSASSNFNFIPKPAITPNLQFPGAGLGFGNTSISSWPNTASTVGFMPNSMVPPAVPMVDLVGEGDSGSLFGGSWGLSAPSSAVLTVSAGKKEFAQSKGKKKKNRELEDEEEEEEDLRDQEDEDILEKSEANEDDLKDEELKDDEIPKDEDDEDKDDKDDEDVDEEDEEDKKDEEEKDEEEEEEVFGSKAKKNNKKKEKEEPVNINKEAVQSHMLNLPFQLQPQQQALMELQSLPSLSSSNPNWVLPSFPAATTTAKAATPADISLFSFGNVKGKEKKPFKQQKEPKKKTAAPSKAKKGGAKKVKGSDSTGSDEDSEKKNLKRKKPQEDSESSLDSDYEDDGDKDVISGSDDATREDSEDMPKKKKKKTKIEPKLKKKRVPFVKKPLSAYMLFLRDVRPEIRKEDPNIAFGEVTKKAAERWQKLEPTLKEYYSKKAEEEMKRYKSDLQALKADSFSKKEEEEKVVKKKDEKEKEKTKDKKEKKEKKDKKEKKEKEKEKKEKPKPKPKPKKKKKDDSSSGSTASSSSSFSESIED